MNRFLLIAVAAALPIMTFGKALTTGYAPVNGLQLYYEIHGAAHPSKPPLVLLHGGGDTITTSFGHLLAELARDRQIIAFEQQGFGHTADIPGRAFSFEQSADDTAALLDHLKIERADLLGFSNGGTIAFQVAIRHPARVRKLVAISALFSRAGGPPEFWDWIETGTLEIMPQELRDAYVATSPHPEKLQSFFDKGAERMRNFKDISRNAMRGIRAPALVIVGDSDVVTPEHAMETFRLLPQAQLAVFPATDHARIMTRGDLVLPVVNDFLNTPAESRPEAGATSSLSPGEGKN